MLQLANKPEGELFQATEQRLIRYGCTEREALALANVVLSQIALETDTSDAVVEQAVVNALVSVKEAVDGAADIEYLGGQRRDTLREATHADYSQRAGV